MKRPAVLALSSCSGLRAGYSILWWGGGPVSYTENHTHRWIYVEPDERGLPRPRGIQAEDVLMPPNSAGAVPFKARACTIVHASFSLRSQIGADMRLSIHAFTKHRNAPTHTESVRRAGLGFLMACALLHRFGGGARSKRPAESTRERREQRFYPCE